MEVERRGGRERKREGEREIKSRVGGLGGGNLENGLGELAREGSLSKPLIFHKDNQCLIFLFSGWFSMFIRLRLLARKISALCEKRHLLLNVCRPPRNQIVQCPAPPPACPCPASLPRPSAAPPLFASSCQLIVRDMKLGGDIRNSASKPPCLLPQALLGSI